MSKRQREETSEERWLRKMKKYENKLEAKRRKTSQRRGAVIYSSDEENAIEVQPQEHLEHVQVHVPAETVQLEESDILVEEAGLTQTQPDTLDIAAPSNGGTSPKEATLDEVSLFDPDLLQALGDAETETVEYGEDLQGDLASRFQKNLLNGLKKETKDELLKKYLYPKNVPLSKGPTLNPEIGAMLVETCRLRDKRLLVKQDQLGRALSALGIGITALLKKNANIPEVIRTLSDAGKLLADSHYAETDTRRSVILPLIDKSLSEPFKDRKRDSFLFGENLGDLVKNSRGIKRTSQLIQAPQTSSLNWNGPPPSSRPRTQQRGGNPYMYTTRVGGPRPSLSLRRRGPPATAPPARRQPPPPPPPPPARRPTSQVQRPPPRRAQ